ncbi:alpha-scruin-like [Ornithodoros turicata]|uniref:alpha-scruin-like n=1 Tax=Ornithodoros turicata TaxID=34597 RepID=UPI00313A1195
MFGKTGGNKKAAGSEDLTHKPAPPTKSAEKNAPLDHRSSAGKFQNSDSAVIALIGGVDLQNPQDFSSGSSALLFQPTQNKWTSFQDMPEPRNYHAAVFYNGYIYVTGGYNPIQVASNEIISQKSVFRYSVQSKSWDRVADMRHARACHGMAVVNDKIMVVGGKDDSGEILQSVEVYNPASDSWLPYRNLPLPLMGSGVAFLDGLLYVAGGITTKKQVFTGTVPSEVLSHVYATDPDERIWMRRPSLPEPRAYSSALTIHHEIWLMGGLKPSPRDLTAYTNIGDVISYDSLRSRWQLRFRLPKPRHGVAVACTDDRIYVLGGMTCIDGTSLDDVDVFHRQRIVFLDCECLPKRVTGACAITMPYYGSGKLTEEAPKNVPPKKQPQKDIKSGGSSSVRLDRGDQSRRRDSASSYLDGDKDRSLDEVEVPASVRRRRKPLSPIDSRGEMDVPDGTSTEGWPPHRLPLEPDTFLGVNELKSRTPIAHPSLPRFYHYVAVAPTNDPHHGISPRVDSNYKHTKEVLGLRDTTGLPAFAKYLRRVKRIRDETLPVILTFGGVDPRDPLNYAIGRVVLHYHILKNRWDLCGMMPEPRSYHAVVLLNDVVYVTGGFDPETRKCGEVVASKATFAYNLEDMEWSRKADMGSARAAHSMVTCLGKLFVFGGRGRLGRALQSCEEYDPTSDAWKDGGTLPEPRTATGCCVLNDKIWLIGGMATETGELYRAVDRVDIYDPKGHSWSAGPTLRKPRAFPSVAVIGSTIWLLGGCYDNSEPGLPLVSLRDVDSLEDDCWVHKGCTVHSRHAAAVAVADTNIYVVGGTSSVLNGPLKRPEVYLQLDDSYGFPAEYPEAMTGIAAVSVPPKTTTFRSSSLTCMIKDELAE